MNDFGMKDSGARQEFETGARRDLQTGKGRPDLIPTLFIQRLAVVMEKGAEKYGDRNWEKGMPLSRYYASAVRHLMQAFDGDLDEDHLGQCAFNVAAFMWTLQEIDAGYLPRELDDRQRHWLNRPFGEDPTDPCSTCVDHSVPPDEGNHTPQQDYEREQYSVTPAGQQLLEGLEDQVAGLPDIEAAHQKLRDAGLVESFDGVWRPRSMPEGTPVQTPICEQKYGETGEL